MEKSRRLCSGDPESVDEAIEYLKRTIAEFIWDKDEDDESSHYCIMPWIFTVMSWDTESDDSNEEFHIKLDYMCDLDREFLENELQDVLDKALSEVALNK